MKYRNEEDKCYGIAGMAIGLTIWNGENLIYKVNLDDEAGDYLQFTSDYYFSGNPAISAKASWNSTMNHFQMTVGMMIANLMCRAKSRGYSYIDIKNDIFDIISKEGKEACSLDDDEVANLYDSVYSHMSRVFRNPAVKEIADSFAARLKDRRCLSNYDVKEILGMLDD